MNVQATLLEDLCMVRLDTRHAADLHALQNVVCQDLARPELYFPVTPCQMLELLGPDGLCLGIAHGEQLVAFFGVLFMGDRPDNVGKDLGLPDEQLPLVAYFMAVNVLPAYRGMGLQQLLTCGLFRLMNVETDHQLTPSGNKVLAQFLAATAATALPSFQWLCSTVSPLNLASVASFMHCGFRIAGLKAKYLGHMRYLMVRERVGAIYTASPYTAVPVYDFELQAKLLMHNKVGVRLDRSHATPTVHYI